MAGSNSLMSIEKLMGRENWASWSFAVKAYLQLEDLYSCILKEPVATDDQSVKQDIKAKSKLILLVDPILYVHIQEAQNAKQVWENLTKAFEDSGLTRKVGLLKELINTNLGNSSSVEEYVNKILTAAHKLRNIKFNVDDEWLGTLMLAGLPEMYKPMIMGLESSGMKISADLVKNKLLQEVQTSDTTALYTNSKNYQPKRNHFKNSKGPRCFNCNKHGHLSQDCWNKKTNNNDKTKSKTGYVAAFSASSTNDSNLWHVDSGASMHMTMHRDWLTEIKPSSVPSIRIANNKALNVECCGNVCIKVNAKDGNTDSIQVRNVLYVPELKTNLLSVSKIIKSGCRVAFNDNGCQIYNQSNKLVAMADLINETYLLNVSRNQEMQAMMAKSDDYTYLWHQRMGHLNFTSINKLPNCTEGVKLSPKAENSTCVTCLEGKQTRKPLPTEGSRATSLLELIHSDVCGPMKHTSIGGARYFVTFIDDFSRRVHVYFIKNKSEVFEKFEEFKNRVENELNSKIKILRSDNGTEYKNKMFDTFLKKHGILHQSSNPYTPEQNGLSERMNRTLIERAKCMILNAELQVTFWAEAVATAAYIVNRSPTCNLSNVTPHEVWTGHKPNLNHMRIFGCPAMVLIPKEKRTKLDVKSRKLIFVGYSCSTKGYRFIDPENKKGILSRDAVFLEASIKRNKVDDIPKEEKKIKKHDLEIEDNKNKSNEVKEKKVVSLPLCEEPEEPVERNTDNEIHARRETQAASPSTCDSDESEHFEDVDDATYLPDTTLDSPPVSNITLRPLQRRMRSHNNDCHQSPSSLICQNIDSTMNSLNSDPQSLQEALNSEKSDEWKKAMDEEYQSLIKNNTWTPVDLPEGKSVIPSRWVYKTKMDSNGNVTRYKARLVIKGYKQVKGIDYNEVYAPVVRYTSIRYLIGLAAKYGLQIHQMDAVTAFLQGEIDEEIYMSLPPGYEDENKVCRLNKSIYGLKQASRQWNKKLNTALLEIGMTRSNIDPCVYYNILNENDMLFIAVYVDDILYFFNNEKTSQMIKEKLKEKFYMKDLGTAKHCIGFRISQNKDLNEISIDQSVYIKMVLTRFGMDNCKPMWTPADANVKLKKAENQQEIMNNIPYQEIIGSLLYLSQGTRPDITYVVNSLSRYNNQPTNEHWMALKRILRYLQATMYMKLVYKRNVDGKILGYCDSDWANDIEDRRSCTGYVFLFQGAAIGWNSKKQLTTALSTSEAEYMALASAIQEALWLKQLGDEFQPELKGDLLRNPNVARHLKKCADEFPLLEMEASLHPITRTVLRIRLTITPNFKWSDKYHGKAPEAFWIWVEDPDNDIMYYNEFFLITKKQVITNEPQELIITIPITEPLPPQYYIRATSERWLGSESVLPLTFQHLILPETHPPHTDLLELQPLPVTALNNPSYEMLYNFSHFNPIQTQIFHCLYHTDNNVLLGAPTGSGKTIVAEIAMFRVFNQYPNCKVVYIAPLKALVKERIKDWKVRLEERMGKKVVELTGDVSPDIRAIRNSHVIVTTPEKWDGISRSWQTRNYVRDVALIVIDEIHLLGEDRGPVLEVIVSRTNFIESHTSRRLRIIGLSTALANAKDLANWLNIGDMGLYNFRPSVRPVPLEVHISGHPGRHYCPRMMTMNKPTFQAIRQHSPAAPALVFVSSRRQTRLTALDLIAYLAAEDNPKQWLHMQESEMELILSNIRETNLKLTLAFGIGIHHAGLHERDRNTVEELFVNQKIQVLICTATLAWGVNFPAHLVVIKGTEYFDGKQKRYVDMPITDVLQMMGRAGRPQYDNEGVAVVLVHDQKKNFYKKFLYEPFPVESSLLEVLADHLNAEIVAGTVQSKQDILDYLTWTYFFRRLLKNPSYYNLESLEPQDINYYLSNLVQTSLDALSNANCVEIEEDQRTLQTTWMGRIASYYYLSHKTMAHFSHNLQGNLDLDALLRVLSDSEEYATLPVRHNEDVLNGELSQQCRLKVDPLSLDSSHVKAFLLLQAHMSRLTLPNTDYLTDTKSVLDQTIRILQAMIDTSAENGWLSVCLSCQMLMQCIIQARWPTDSPLTTLPHVESHHLYMFTQMSNELKKPCNMLNGLKVSCVRNYEALAKHMRREFETNQIEQIHRAVCDLPTLDLKLKVRGLWFDSDGEQDKTLRQPPHRDQWQPLHAEQEYTLLIDMQRRGGNPNTVLCPRFPRGKNEGWFVTLGTVEHGELHALKRTPARGSALVTFCTPNYRGRIIYTLYLMSDSYMGLDQQFDLQFELIDPLPEERVDRVYDNIDKTIIE